MTTHDEDRKVVFDALSSVLPESGQLHPLFILRLNTDVGCSCGNLHNSFLQEEHTKAEVHVITLGMSPTHKLLALRPANLVGDHRTTVFNLIQQMAGRGHATAAYFAEQTGDVVTVRIEYSDRVTEEWQGTVIKTGFRPRIPRFIKTRDIIMMDSTQMLPGPCPEQHSPTTLRPGVAADARPN